MSPFGQAWKVKSHKYFYTTVDYSVLLEKQLEMLRGQEGHNLSWIYYIKNEMT